MEPTKVIKKRREIKQQVIYSRNLLTRKIVLPIKYVGKNLDDVIEEYLRNNIEGKCVTEGYIRSGSIKIIRYSSGVVERGNNVRFEVVFECDVCFPVEGMLISCVVKNITKAGIRAESANETPSPVVVFLAKDHHFSSHHFSEIKEGDIISARVIGSRFELNDISIGVLGELVRDKEFVVQKKQPVKKRIEIHNEEVV